MNLLVVQRVNLLLLQFITSARIIKIFKMYTKLEFLKGCRKQHFVNQNSRYSETDS